MNKNVKNLLLDVKNFRWKRVEVAPEIRDTFLDARSTSQSLVSPL